MSPSSRIPVMCGSAETYASEGDIKLLKDYKRHFENDGFVSSSQTDIKGKGQALPFPFTVHTQQIETPKAMNSAVPISPGDHGLCTQLHSTAEPEGPRPIIPCVYMPWKCFSKPIH